MEFKKVKWEEVDRAVWNKWASQTESASYYHSWDWINYMRYFDGIQTHNSFALFDQADRLLALCPFAQSVVDGKQEISFAGVPCGAPALTEMNRSQHRKVLDHIMGEILSITEVEQIAKIRFFSHPITSGACKKNDLSSAGMFELLRYRMHCRVHNTLVMDLGLSDLTLSENLSKYQKRHIEHGQKKGIRVQAFNLREHPDQLDIQFIAIQEAHFRSAGKRTRPQKTWDAMREAARSGQGTLFVAFTEEVPVSYLYCGEFNSMAFGFSQVNVNEYEKEFSPRHLLEWEAIEYYKKHEFHYYVVGERYYGPQVFRTPTPKEISIGVFKERYGGMLLPSVFWTGYCNKDILENELIDAVHTYLESAPLMSLPEN